MSRKVLDSNVGESDVDAIMNSIVAQNPQLNAQIEQVRNESNVFLCEVLRIYPYEDRAFVRILNNNKKIYCRLSHEILSNGMCVDYLPNGIEKTIKGRTFVKPFDRLYGIIIKVRWENLTDENVLLGYVNIYDNYDLRSSNDTGELSLKSGSSVISVDDERINIMTPALFINGLPYEEPELNNYYDKNETNVITNSLKDLIDNNDEVTKEELERLDDRIDDLEIGNLNLSNYDVDFDVNFGLSGLEDIINVDVFLKHISGD